MSRAYLNRTELWEKAQVNANSLKFVKYETRNIVPRYPYTPKRQRISRLNAKHQLLGLN